MLKYPLLLQAQRYTYTVAFILSSSEVILLYSRYTREGLTYIAIAAPSSRQSFSYSKYTRLNTYFSYNVQLVSNAKCILYLHSPSNGNTQ